MRCFLFPDGTLRRTAGQADAEPVELPLKDGRLILPAGVRVIDDWTFSYRRDLREVVFPEGLAAIGGWAFRSCQNLSSLRLPEGLQTLGQAAFSGCMRLRSVHLPDSLTDLPAGVFHGCRSLSELHLPPVLFSVGAIAFSGCERLTALTLPEGLRTLGRSAFAGCTELRQAGLPDSLAALPAHLFQGCRRLQEVRFPAALTAIGENAFSGKLLLNLSGQPFADGRGPVLWLPGGIPSAERDGDRLALTLRCGAREITLTAGEGHEPQILWPGPLSVLPPLLRNPALRGFLRAERAGDARLAARAEDYAKHCRADRTLQLALLNENMEHLPVMTRGRMISRGALGIIQKKLLDRGEAGPIAVWLDYLLREGLLTPALVRGLMERADSTDLSALYLEYLHRLPPEADGPEAL